MPHCHFKEALLWLF